MGRTVDISALLRFHFYEEVFYKINEDTFPSDSKEEKGHFIGIGENVGHKLTYIIWNKETNQVLERSEVHPLHTGPNKRLDLLSGEDLDPHNKNLKNYVRTESDTEFPDDNGENSENPSANGESTEQNKESLGTLKDSLGKTFLVPQQEDGQKPHARMTEAIEEHLGDIENNKERVKFRISMNNDQFEDILTYQQVLDHISKDETS